MLEEDQKAAIREGIMHAFDKWGLREKEDYFTAMADSSKDQRAVHSKAWREQAFLVRRVRAPGLFQFVEGETIRSPVLKKHRLFLINAALTSIASSKPPILRDLGHRRARDSHASRTGPARNSYDRRTIQRLRHEEYPEVLFDFDEYGRGDDCRLQSVSSVFAPTKPPPRESTPIALDYLAFEAVRFAAQGPRMEEVLPRAVMNLARPTYLRDYLECREECSAVIKRLSSSDNANKDVLVFLRDEFSEPMGLNLVLYNHLMSMLAVKWYRSQRHQTKARLLGREFPVRYTVATARDALAALTELLMDSGFAIQTMRMGEQAFHSLGYFKPCLAIESVLLDELHDDDDARALCLDNMAASYLGLGRSEEARRAWKKAIGIYRRSGQEYRELICEKNVALAHAREGKRDLSLAKLREVRGRIPGLKAERDRVGVILNLAVAYRKVGDREFEQTTLREAMEFPLSDQQMINVSARLLELD